MIEKMVDGLAFWQEIAKRLSKKQKTNFFFSEDEVLLLVQKEKFSRFDFGESAYIFLKEERFCRLYYFLDKENCPEVLPAFAEPIILEEVLLAKKERVPSVKDWGKVGFQEYLIRKRMYLASNNVLKEERKITFATEDLLEEIFQLMLDSFEPFSSALPTKEALLEDIMNQKVLVSVKNQKLLGFLHFGEIKQGSMLWHIAVKPGTRGLGIGQGLVRDWLFVQKDISKKFFLWVRMDNLSALRMYDKLGFLPDGRVAPVMIKTT